MACPPNEPADRQVRPRPFAGMGGHVEAGREAGVIAGGRATNIKLKAEADAETSGGRCVSRREVREERERGNLKPPSALEAPLYRPFALLALGVTLGVATPIGAIALFNLYASAGAVPGVWPRLHAYLQLFGFVGILIIGVGHHLVLRFAHRPIRRPARTPWILGLAALALAARVAAAATTGPPAAALWVGSGIAGPLAYGLFALWVTGHVRAIQPRFTSDWLLVSGAWWFTLGLATEAVALVRAATAGGDPALATPGPGLYAMGLYGGVFGWVLGVALRVAPMFLVGRKVGRWGGPALLALNGGVLLALLAEVWPPDSRPAHVLVALSDLGVAGALVVGALAVGAWQPEPRRAIALHMDRTEARFFRLAFACAGLAALGLVVGAVLTFACVAKGMLTDATRHLLTVGFVIGAICAMGFRFLPVIEGVRLALPRARQVAFWALLAAVLLRTAELGADYLHEGFLRPAALSGFLAWLALAAWGLAVALTMVRGAAARRHPIPHPFSPTGEREE